MNASANKKNNQLTIIGQGEFNFENNASFEMLKSRNQVEFLRDKNYSIKIEPTALNKLVVEIDVTLPLDTVFAYVSALAVRETIMDMETIEIKRMNVSFTRLPDDPIDSKHTVLFSEIPAEYITEEILLFSNPIMGVIKVKATAFSK